MSLRTLKPRMKTLSPKLTVPLAPSPMLIVMPGVLRSTSRSEVALCSSNTFCGMTTISCGVSRISSRYFGDCAVRGTLPATSTNSLTPADRQRHRVPSNVARTDKPASSCVHRLLGREVARHARATAACAGRGRRAPGECCVTRSNAASTVSSEPGAMSNRMTPARGRGAGDDRTLIAAGGSAGDAAASGARQAAPRTNRRVRPPRRRRAVRGQTGPVLHRRVSPLASSCFQNLVDGVGRADKPVRSGEQTARHG